MLFVSALACPSFADYSGSSCQMHFEHDNDNCDCGPLSEKVKVMASIPRERSCYAVHAMYDLHTPLFSPFSPYLSSGSLALSLPWLWATATLTTLCSNQPTPLLPAPHVQHQHPSSLLHGSKNALLGSGCRSAHDLITL